MELSTQCPRCGTVFPATLEQLQLRKGYIRCINCAHIFDGYDAVVTGEPAVGAAAPAPEAALASEKAPIEKAPEKPMPSVLRQRAAVHGSDAVQRAPGPVPDQAFSVRIPDEDDIAEGPRFTLSSARLPARQRPEPSLAGGPAVAASGMDTAQGGQRHAAAPGEPTVGDAAVYAEPGIAHDPRPAVYAEPRRGDDAEPLPEFLETRNRRWRSALRMFWGVLSLFGLVVLLGQLAYIYRGQIADHSPELRPMLQQACVALKCDVPYARRILLIAITNSSLRAMPASVAPAGGKDAGGKNDSSRMLLQLTLRNNDDRAQEWPTLTLDLVDFSGSVVSKKNLAPGEYLPPGLRGSPFAAHSEVALAVPLTVSGYHVNGYQLGKFFP